MEVSTELKLATRQIENLRSSTEGNGRSQLHDFGIRFPTLCGFFSGARIDQRREAMKPFVSDPMARVPER